VKHAREDYNEITTDGVTRRIPKDEPVFLLRAQDACSADAVRHWAALAEGAGAHPEIVSKAREHAALMDAWPVKKVPDLPGYEPTPPEVDENAVHDDPFARDHEANQRMLDEAAKS
jgi:hypothetical protein